MSFLLQEEVTQLKLQSVSTMQRYEGDPEKPAPGLGSNNLLRKVSVLELFDMLFGRGSPS